MIPEDGMTDKPYTRLCDEIKANLVQYMQRFSLEDLLERILFCPFVYSRLCSESNCGHTNCTIVCRLAPQTLISDIQSLLDFGRSTFARGAFTFHIRDATSGLVDNHASHVSASTTLTISFDDLHPSYWSK